MTTIELRSKIHSLIDSLKSEELLERIHDLLANSGEDQRKGVWGSMTETQQQRVMQAYASSFDPKNLSSTEEVLKRRKS